MTLTVRLPLRVEQELAAYCVTHRVTKSDAVKRALERLLTEEPAAVSAFALGRRGFGADKTEPRNVARQSKRLLRERFDGKPYR